MKNKYIFTFIFLLLSFIFSPMTAFAIEQTCDVDISYESIKEDVIAGYIKPEKTVWKKYFKKQAKTIKKIWKKSPVHLNSIYDTSYVRVLVFVNKDGKIISYETKSSCIPYGDTVFKKEVENVLSKVKFSNLPNDYNYHLIAFTLKFHSQLPANINVSRLNWDRYGLADIELSNKKIKTIIKE